MSDGVIVWIFYDFLMMRMKDMYWHEYKFINTESILIIIIIISTPSMYTFLAFNHGWVECDWVSVCAGGSVDTDSRLVSDNTQNDGLQRMPMRPVMIVYKYALTTTTMWGHCVWRITMLRTHTVHLDDTQTHHEHTTHGFIAQQFSIRRRNTHICAMTMCHMCVCYPSNTHSIQCHSIHNSRNGGHTRIQVLFSGKSQSTLCHNNIIANLVIFIQFASAFD